MLIDAVVVVDIHNVDGWCCWLMFLLMLMINDINNVNADVVVDANNVDRCWIAS